MHDAGVRLREAASKPLALKRSSQSSDPDAVAAPIPKRKRNYLLAELVKSIPSKDDLSALFRPSDNAEQLCAMKVQFLQEQMQAARSKVGQHCFDTPTGICRHCGLPPPPTGPCKPMG